MNYVIASGPVIIENNAVLLNKDPDDPFWKFPGGKWELYDLSDWEQGLEEVARREAKEEVGIDIEIIRPLKPMMLKNSETIIVLIHWLSKRIGEIVPGGDTTEWAWHDISLSLPTAHPTSNPSSPTTSQAKSCKCLTSYSTTRRRRRSRRRIPKTSTAAPAVPPPQGSARPPGGIASEVLPIIF